MIKQLALFSFLATMAYGAVIESDHHQQDDIQNVNDLISTSTEMSIGKDSKNLKNHSTPNEVLAEAEDLSGHQERFLHSKANAHVGDLHAGTKLHICAKKGIGGEVSVHAGRHRIAHANANLKLGNDLGDDEDDDDYYEKEKRRNSMRKWKNKQSRRRNGGFEHEEDEGDDFHDREYFELRENSGDGHSYSPHGHHPDDDDEFEDRRLLL